MRRFRLSKVQRGLLSGELQAIKAPVGRLIAADSEAGKAALPSFLEDLRQIADGLKGIETDMNDYEQINAENEIKDGIVDFYNAEKGYGFIVERGTGEKSFFHFSKTNLPPNDIKPGMLASYATRIDPYRNRPQAYEIILYENT